VGSYRPNRTSPSKTHSRKHILGMSTSPRKDLHCPKLCRLSCTLITNTPRKYPFLVVLGNYKTVDWFNGLRMRTLIHVFYFKNAQNRCKISGRKSALYWWQKKTKHVLASVSGTHGAILRNFLAWVRTVTPHLYSGFLPDPFMFGWDITKNPSTTPRVNAIQALRAYNKEQCDSLRGSGMSAAWTVH